MQITYAKTPQCAPVNSMLQSSRHAPWRHSNSTGISMQMSLTVILLCIVARIVSSKVVPPFTSWQQGGDWTGKTIRIRPASVANGGPQVIGAEASVINQGLTLDCETGCEDIIDIYAPVGFNSIGASGVGGVIRVSDHDDDPMTCKAGLFRSPEWQVAVSASTNVSLGCITTDSLVLRQSGEVSTISTWWTVKATRVTITNTGEGASTHLLGTIADINIEATGEKATVTVRDADAVITGTSVGGRIYYNAEKATACDVMLPGPLGSACLPLPSLDVPTIRALSFNSWSSVATKSNP